MYMKVLYKSIGFFLLGLTSVSCQWTASEVVRPLTQKREVKTTPTVNPKHLINTVFEIHGMTCEYGCAKYIEKKLIQQNGVVTAKVDFATQKAYIQFDKSRQTADDLQQMIRDLAGGHMYKVSLIQ